MMRIPTRKLGEIADFLNGGTPSRKVPEYFRGNIPWITGNDVVGFRTSKGRECITEDAVKHSATHLVPKGAVLFVTRTGVGKVSIADADICISQDLTGVVPKNGVNAEYLARYLIFISDRIKGQQRGTTILGITREVVADIVVPLPAFPIQKQIAAILEKADAAREKRRQANQLTEQFLQSAFLEMFGDPVTNPKAWEKRELGDCITDKPNNGFFAKSHHYHDDGVPIIWISDFINRFYSKTTELKRVRLIEENIRKYTVQYGDALFCRSSLNYEGVGKAGIIPKELKNTIIFECHIIRLRLDLNKVVPEFFRQLSDLPYFRNQIKSRAKTATMTTIGQEGITSCSLILPPIAEQHKFAALVNKVELLRAKQRESEKELENLFQSLMQRAFRGELITE